MRWVILALVVPALSAVEARGCFLPHHSTWTWDADATAAELELRQAGRPCTGARLHRVVAFAADADHAQRSAAAWGLTHLHPGPVRGTWLATAPSAAEAARIALAMTQARATAWAVPLIAQRHHLRVIPGDPAVPQQWHLSDSLLNCRTAWAAGWTGAGITIAVVDGLFHQTQTDVSPAYRLDQAFDALSTDPLLISAPWTTDLNETHATFCAGLAAARGENGIGGVGVAWNANLIPVRVVPITAGDPIPTDADDAEALHHVLDTAAVINCSWGPEDDGRTTESPGTLLDATLNQLATTGRASKGTVVTWASGNGYNKGDNVAYDGFASHPQVLAVGALNIHGLHAWYSEGGPALFICTPGGGDNAGEGLVGPLPPATYASPQAGLMGTSFAAPIAAGVVALMLEANPNLTQRDVRALLATTAQPPDPLDSAWQRTTQGHPWHPLYGFGRIDATAAVTAALSAQPLPPATTPISVPWSGSLAIPDDQPPGGGVAVVSFPVSVADDFRLESVVLAISISHPSAGDLDILLTAPSGRTALVPGRPLDTHACVPLQVHAVGFLDESPNGTWTVTVRDHRTTHTGTLISCTLTCTGHRLSGDTSPGGTIPAAASGTIAGNPTPTASPAVASSSHHGGGCLAGGASSVAMAVFMLARRRRGRTTLPPPVESSCASWPSPSSPPP